MSSTAMKAPPPTPIFNHRAIASHAVELVSGRDTPLVHSFGSFHMYRVSYRHRVGERESERETYGDRNVNARVWLYGGVYVRLYEWLMQVFVPHLDCTLAGSFYLVEVALGAEGAGAQTLPQEVESTSITRACRTGTAHTRTHTHTHTQALLKPRAGW